MFRKTTSQNQNATILILSLPWTQEFNIGLIMTLSSYYPHIINTLSVISFSICKIKFHQCHRNVVVKYHKVLYLKCHRRIIQNRKKLSISVLEQQKCVFYFWLKSIYKFSPFLHRSAIFLTDSEHRLAFILGIHSSD